VRKIVASMLMALDGVVENPEWTVQFRREESQKYKFDELFASDALLLGRRTYQEFAAGWPSMQGTGEYGERMNSLPKFVVSTTLAATGAGCVDFREWRAGPQPDVPGPDR